MYMKRERERTIRGAILVEYRRRRRVSHGEFDIFLDEERERPLTTTMIFSGDFEKKHSIVVLGSLNEHNRIIQDR